MKENTDNLNALDSSKKVLLPIVFCLDVSGSMSGRIPELQRCLQQFIDDIKSDKVAMRTAQVAIIAFSDTVDIVQDFVPVVDWQVPQLTADGGTVDDRTDLIGAVETALQMLEDKKQSYKSEDCPYFSPWLVILSDGGQNPENPSELDRIAERVSELIGNKKLATYPIGIGDNVDWENLKKFSIDQGFALEFKNGQSFRSVFRIYDSSTPISLRVESLRDQIDLGEVIINAFKVKR